MKTRHWSLVGLIVLPLVAIGILSTPRYLGPTKTGNTALQAKQIVAACEAYRDNAQNPERGTYPRNLIDLVHPPFGGGSFLKNGEAELLDAWGRPFEYAAEKSNNGETEIRVWSVRVVNGEQRVIGAKQHASGNVETWGED